MDNRDKKVAILDFDGTLADIMPLVKKIAKQHVQIEITDELLDKLRKGTLRQALKELDIKSWQLPAILNRARKIIYHDRGSLKLFPGIEGFIKQLSDDGWDIYILSTNREDTIDAVLQKNNIRQYVEIIKRPSLFGKSVRIKSLIRSKRYNPSNVWIAGDETRDLVAGNRAGINTIAVSWGLQHESVLEKHNPKFVAKNVTNLKEIFKKVG